MPGALLLRMGVLRPADLAAATALQERDGGSFGECLVRLGFIDEEQLAEFYKSRLMITPDGVDYLENHYEANVRVRRLPAVS